MGTPATLSAQRPRGVVIGAAVVVFIVVMLFSTTSPASSDDTVGSSPAAEVPVLTPTPERVQLPPRVEPASPPSVAKEQPPMAPPQSRPPARKQQKNKKRLGFCPTSISVLTDPDVPDGNFHMRSSFIWHVQKAVLEESTHSAVIIGANEGDTATDFAWKLLSKSPMKKLLVEPIPALFKLLEMNLAASGMRSADARNVAIGANDGVTLPMYCFNFNVTKEKTVILPTNDEGSNKAFEVPNWFSQLCSFDKARLYNSSYDTRNYFLKFVEKGLIKRLGDAVNYIKVMDIPTATARTLVQNFTHGNLADITYVQIDTEGFDYNVVKQLPFESEPTFRPCIIVWEFVLLTKEQNVELVEMIKPFGYLPYRDDQNYAMVRVR